MSERFSEELISAYLDGELTPAEREEVERALRDDAESQRLLEDFRALRARLQSLPRPALGEDFHRQVLQRAEKAMLAAPVATSTVEPKTNETHSGGGGSNGRNLRRWMWPSLAVAAALLVMAVQQFQNEPEQVAVQRSPEGSSSGSIGALHDEAASPQLDEGRVADRDRPAASDVYDYAPGQPSRGLGVDGTDGIVGERLAREEAAPPSEPATPRANVPQIESQATDDRMLRQRTIEPEAAPPAEARLGEAVAPAPDALATQLAVTDSPAVQSDALAGNVYFVEVSQTADAARQRTFERVLDSEGIAVIGDAVVAGAYVVPEGGTRSMAEAEELDERNSRSKLAAGAAPDLIYVEAGADKMQRVLTKLNQQKGTFPSVSSNLGVLSDGRSVAAGGRAGAGGGQAGAESRAAGSERLSTSNFGGQAETRYQNQPLQRRAVPLTQDADADVASRSTNEPAADAEFAPGQSNRELAFSHSYADPRGPAAGEVQHGPPAPTQGEPVRGETLGRAVRLQALQPAARPESLMSRNGVADSEALVDRVRSEYGVTPYQEVFREPVERQQQLGQGRQAGEQPADEATAAPPAPQASAAMPVRVLFRLRVADPHGPPEPAGP
ncbi:MAG: zf-HC2 domain-containing protein [Pirellulales bacterium]